MYGEGRVAAVAVASAVAPPLDREKKEESDRKTNLPKMLRMYRRLRLAKKRSRRIGRKTNRMRERSCINGQTRREMTNICGT